MIKTFICKHCGKRMQNGQRHSCKAMKMLGMWDKKAVDGEPNFVPGPPEVATIIEGDPDCVDIFFENTL